MPPVFPVSFSYVKNDVSITRSRARTFDYVDSYYVAKIQGELFIYVPIGFRMFVLTSLLLHFPLTESPRYSGGKTRLALDDKKPDRFKKARMPRINNIDETQSRKPTVS